MDLTAKHGVVQQDILKGECTPAMKDAIFDLASQAHAHLDAGEWVLRVCVRHQPSRDIEIVKFFIVMISSIDLRL